MAKSGRRAVTQNDVAREAGVTRSLVSYVISGNTERSVAPETRKRILEVIDRLGYRPNVAAQTLQQGEVAMASKKIGVVLNSADVFRRPYYAEIIEGIHTAAHENKYSVSFIRFFEELKDPILFNQLIHEENIGSMILISTGSCLKTEEDKIIIEKIKERIRRTVCVEWQYDGLSSVSFDRLAAGKQAVEYLYQKGFRDIAYVGQNDDRVDGVQQGFLHHDMKADRKSFYLGECFNSLGGYHVMQRLAGDDDESDLNGKSTATGAGIDDTNNSGERFKNFPRAIICGSDEVAIGVLCYLNKNKIAVPQKVALISIDNIEASAYTCPPLTTINVQKGGMGYRAVNMIVQSANDKVQAPVNINLPTEIVERFSV